MYTCICGHVCMCVTGFAKAYHLYTRDIIITGNSISLNKNNELCCKSVKNAFNYQIIVEIDLVDL